MRYIPFLHQFHDKVRRSEKTMTARTEKYGEPGDMLVTNIYRYGPEFLSLPIRIQLLEVRRVRLGDIAERHWHEEGCESMDDFKAVWTRIHPRAGYDPAKRVWLHIFRKVVDEEVVINEA